MLALAHPSTAQIAAAKKGHETSRPVLPETKFRQTGLDNRQAVGALSAAQSPSSGRAVDSSTIQVSVLMPTQCDGSRAVTPRQVGQH